MSKVKKGAATFAAAALAIGSALPLEGNVGARADSALPLYSMEQMLTPVWDGEISYQESVLVVEEADGTIAPIELLYPIAEIKAVKSATLTTVYQKDVDYSVSEGKLVITPSGSIPRLTYAEFHPETGTAGFEDRNGGYVLWKEGAWYHERQIVVTYTHTQPYQGYVPEGKGRLLENSRAKLKAGATVNLLVYGDSISAGGNSSGNSMVNVSPFMPIYPDLFAEGLKMKYGLSAVNVHNASVGGKDSNWGVSDIKNSVLDQYTDLDLAIVAFGMNDTKRDAESYAYNIKRIVSTLKKTYPGIDVLVVAPMLPNERAVTFWGNQEHFYDALMEFEGQGVVAVDVTGMHKSLLETKRYADMTGNNINHANDYLARIYAQTLLRAFDVTEYGAPAEEPDPPPAVQDPNTPPTEEPDPPTENPSGEDKKGCNGSVAAGVSALPLCAATVAAVVAVKKKKKK